MPETYRVTDPRTGLKVRVTGESPPTEAELEEIFAKLSPAKPAQPSRNDEAMASLREMAQMNEPLTAEELDTSALERSTAPAMVGAMAVPAMAASPIMRAAGSPLGMGALNAGLAYGRGGDALDVAAAGISGVGAGAGLGALANKLPGAAGVSARILNWIRRGKAAAPAAETAAVAAEAGPVVEASRAATSAFPKNPAEAAAAMRAPKPAPAAESSTLEEQLRQTVKMSRAAKKALPEAQNLEARIVEWKTRQGQSEGQIVDSLKTIFGIREPGAAKEMTDLVLRAHGLKR